MHIHVCCSTVFTHLLHSFYTDVTLLLHCYYIVITPSLHCCYNVVTLLLPEHCWGTPTSAASNSLRLSPSAHRASCVCLRMRSDIRKDQQIAWRYNGFKSLLRLRHAGVRRCSHKGVHVPHCEIRVEDLPTLLREGHLCVCVFV
jgi:hypothetical protein